MIDADWGLNIIGRALFVSVDRKGILIILHTDDGNTNQKAYHWIGDSTLFFEDG